MYILYIFVTTLNRCEIQLNLQMDNVSFVTRRNCKTCDQMTRKISINLLVLFVFNIQLLVKMDPRQMDKCLRMASVIFGNVNSMVNYLVNQFVYIYVPCFVAQIDVFNFSFLLYYFQNVITQMQLKCNLVDTVSVVTR